MGDDEGVAVDRESAVKKPLSGEYGTCKTVKARF